jgi:hypothetical protein
MIEIDLALTRELQAIVPAVQYAQQLRSATVAELIDRAPSDYVATSNERSVVDTQCSTPTYHNIILET